ncbi:MAG: hypothetical protein AB1478_02690 [Nitrospirota bacterium]
MEQHDEITIDERNRQNIMDILKAINELQGRLTLICQTIVNCLSKEGVYKLSEDFTKLVKQKEK